MVKPDPAFFITGTDTGVGKTLITSALISLLAEKGLKVAGMKPVASGSRETVQGLRNDDAEMLMAHSNLQMEYTLINPYVFAAPVAPHVAAQKSGQKIVISQIMENYNVIRQRADVILVEGVGGWRVPLNEYEELSDLAALLSLPIILIVGLRLGCINHALLTADAISRKGLKLLACVASQIDPDYLYTEETLQTLRQRLKVPLEFIPWQKQARPDLIKDYLTETVQQLYENI